MRTNTYPLCVKKQFSLPLFSPICIHMLKYSLFGNFKLFILILDHENVRVDARSRRQDKQWSDSIGRTVLQTVAEKLQLCRKFNGMTAYICRQFMLTTAFLVISPAVKAPILGEACIRVRIKYFYSFMTFGPY